MPRRFPADGFQGEEGGISRGGSLRWVVDPIDGTSNFARGAARFCVSLACLEGDTPLIGVIVAPALRETIWAWRGGGAWLNGDPVRAAETTQDVQQAIMEVGWSRRRPNADYLKVCERVLADGAGLRHGGSGALGLADVAVGRLDGYAELHINLWDVAAALVILREAGAKVSDFLAGDGAAKGNAIVACAPGLAGPGPTCPDCRRRSDGACQGGRLNGAGWSCRPVSGMPQDARPSLATWQDPVPSTRRHLRPGGRDAQL